MDEIQKKREFDNYMKNIRAEDEKRIRSSITPPEKGPVGKAKDSAFAKLFTAGYNTVDFMVKYPAVIVASGVSLLIVWAAR
jgi:hypothetical protein